MQSRQVRGQLLQVEQAAELRQSANSKLVIMLQDSKKEQEIFTGHTHLNSKRLI